jgi:hypothetical protein
MDNSLASVEFRVGVRRLAGSVPTYVQKAWRLEFASGHGKKLIAKSIS